MADPREQVPEQDERQWQDDMSWEPEYQQWLDELELILGDKHEHQSDDRQ